ncbi:MAG: beta-galactosidase [Actinomycetaceae bacterium]|nr:beta-galactosidase [Actinomycetaceae bacterium]
MTILPTRDVCYGGDWNPDQWPAQTVAEDIELMKEAGVNLVSLAIFSWAKLEPKPGEYDFAWLRDIMDRCHEAGIFVDLATGTAAPPVWMARNNPESLPVNKDGVRLGFGSRQQYCPSSREYRSRSKALARALAEEFKDHPALVMWHVNNEYACHVPHCYCDVCEADFQDWLRDKYGDISALNDAWNTHFWAQVYSDFDQIYVPRTMPTIPNSAQVLDFWRFSDSQILKLYLGEAEQLREVTPGIPVTTNFMGEFTYLDYREWAKHVDVVSDDSYPDPALPGAAHEVAFNADLMRGLKGGQPFVLMEQVTSAVQWRPQNTVKRPGQFELWSLSRVAHGADGVMQFQWRQSPGGAEMFHGGMVHHSGKKSRWWSEVVKLGGSLSNLAPVVGGRVDAKVAVVVDTDSARARHLSCGPNEAPALFSAARAWHRSLWEKNIATDIIGVEDDLAGYSVIVVPELFIDYPKFAARLQVAAENGAHVLVTAPSGVVNPTLRAVLGGYLGSLSDLLGVVVTDYAVHSPDAAKWAQSDLWMVDPRVDRITRAVETPGVVDYHDLEVRSAALVRALEQVGSPRPAPRGGVWGEYVMATKEADQFTDPMWLNDEVEVVAQFAPESDLGGWPAITKRKVGKGAAWYVATDLDAVGRDALVRVLAAYGRVDMSASNLPDGIEVVKRGVVTFYLNHSDRAVQLAGVTGFDLLSQAEATGHAVVAPRSAMAIVSRE